MTHAPDYVWGITIAGLAAFTVTTAAVLRSGALDAGAGRRRANALATWTVLVIGGWAVATGAIASHGYYQTRLGQQPPWLPIATLGSLGVLLGLGRVPAVSRALAPSMLHRLVHPHSARVAGLAFVVMMLAGRLPPLFAIPAGLGDVAVGVAAFRLASRQARGEGTRSLLWFNALGITDLATAMVLGGLIGFTIIHVHPSGAAISQLPLVLIPTAEVPALLALHIASLRSLRTRSRSSLAETGSALDAVGA